MTCTVRGDDPRLSWLGAVSVESTDRWTMPWRIPHEERGLFAVDRLIERAGTPSGVRLAFRSDTRCLAARIEPDPEAKRLDLCVDDRRAGSVDLAGKEGFAFDDLSPGDKRLDLWLPTFGTFRLRGLELPDGASLEPVRDTRPRWVAYGSSITQCRQADHPTETWPAVVARGRGLNLTSLGFGGECHLDPMVIRLMRDLPADLISLCLGINIYGGATLGPRAFRPAIIGAVRLIRDTHPGVPIALMSPIWSAHREATLNAVGFTVEAMRREVAAAAEALRAHGDADVHYVDGLDILGPDHADRLPDDLHPDAEGYRIMGRNFLDKVIPVVFPAGAGEAKGP